MPGYIKLNGESYGAEKVVVVQDDNQSDILWVNPNPKTAFPAQTITLKKPLSEYDSFEISYYMHLEDEEPYTGTSGKIPLSYTKGISLRWGSSGFPARNCIFVDENKTKILIEVGWWMGNINNNISVPIQIVGYKYPEKPKVQTKTLLWENPNPTVSFPTQEIALLDDIKKYDSFEVICQTDTNNLLYISNTFIFKIGIADGFTLREVGNAGEGIYRSLNFIDGKNIKIWDAYVNATKVPNKLVPVQIYGHRLREEETIALDVPYHTNDPNDVFEEINPAVTFTYFGFVKNGHNVNMGFTIKINSDVTRTMIAKLKPDFSLFGDNRIVIDMDGSLHYYLFGDSYSRDAAIQREIIIGTVEVGRSHEGSFSYICSG